MFNKFKFIPLILIFLVTFSFSVQVPLSSDSYDYRFRISAAGDMWLYDGVVDGVSEHCQYTKYENNPYVNPNFNESAFKKDSFYAQSGPATKSPSGYFDNPASLYKFLGYETINGNQILKYETYSWVMKPGAAIQKICVQCNTKAGEYFDSTTGLCVNKCEDIANRRDRFNCMCKRAGKLDFVSVADHVIGHDSVVCSYICTTTKDDPEASVGGDGNFYNVSYEIHDTDPNANGVCFTDDNYIHGTNSDKPDNPNPGKPDNPNPGKPDNPNPGKPDNPNPGKPDKPDPDKPNQGGGGHPGGGSNPGNNNGTKPGNSDNNNGTKPGDDDNGKFDFGKLNELNEAVEGGTNKFMKIFEDAKDQIVGAYNRLKKGKLSDFKVHGSVNSCPYTRDFVIKDGLSKKIIIDICAVVKDTRPVIYFIFYALFLFLFSLFTYKAVARLL